MSDPDPSGRLGAEWPERVIGRSPPPADSSGMRLLLSMAPILLMLGLTAAFLQAVFVGH
jgi:hypothetical protein